MERMNRKSQSRKQKIRRIRRALTGGVLALLLLLGGVLCPSGLFRVQAETLADGVYTINGSLRHATQDQSSMGDGAIEKPMQLTVENGEATLTLSLVPLTASLGSLGSFTGYLAELSYFPDWDSDALPTDETPVSLDLISEYEGVYDSYNDPNTGTDATVRGLYYPKEMSMPVTIGDTEIWTEVYVPVMEAISTGSGRQYAKLQLDWSTATRTGDLPSETTTASESDSTSTTVDKSALHTLLLSAASMVGRTSSYTEESLTALKTAIDKAEAVYANKSATQTQVDAQVRSLTRSVLNLEEKESSSSSSSSSSSEEDLDIASLSDGTYSIEGKMYKVDKKTLSMSNDAIDHTIKLKVKKGKYKLILDFKGLQINSQYGYLGQLKYFKSGYKTNSAGSPTGTVKSAKVKSYQKDSSGNRVSDSFGTNYPDKVQFPMIEEAKEDGWVPLQVFVPIMDAISAGTGTQAVYLKLDLSSLSSGSGSSSDDDDSSDSSSGTTSSSSGSSSSGSTTSASALKSGSTLPSSDSSSGSSAGTTAGTADTAADSVLSSTGITAASSDTEAATATEAAETTTDTAETETESEEDSDSSSAIPAVMSFLAVAAGGFYKAWSRRLFWFS